MAQKTHNLDAILSEMGFELAQHIDKNLIEKLLGVLVNDGVYAMWVVALNKLDWQFEENKENLENYQLFRFLNILSKLNKYLSDSTLIWTEEKASRICSLTSEINDLKKHIKNDKNNQNKQLLKQKVEERDKELSSFFQSLSNDLHQLLFFRQLLEKALIYARYHAKAKGE